MLHLKSEKFKKWGNGVKRRNLIGMWERQSQGIEKHYYEFLPNDSFRIKAVTQYANPFYNGDILCDALSVTINKGQDKLEVKVGRTEDETVTLYFKRLKDSDMLQ